MSDTAPLLASKPEPDVKSEPDIKRRRLDPEVADDSSAEVVAWMRSSPISVFVEVSDNGQSETFHVHDGALRQLPYFEAYAGRWAKGEELKVRLPPEVGIEDFERLMGYIYTGRLAVGAVQLRRAVALYLLADMMLVKQLMSEALAEISRLAQSVEDLAELRGYAASPGGRGLLVVVDELETNREQPFLPNLVKSVIGDGNRVLGCEDVLDLKTRILQDKLQDRAGAGLEPSDALVVLELLKTNAWIGTVYYDQAFKVSPQLFVVWQMVESGIVTEGAFALARDLAAELDRPSGFNRVSYRGEQRYCLAFSGNRDLAVEVLQGIVRVGARLANLGIVSCSEVLGMLPQHYEMQQFETILQPALEMALSNVELLLPYLQRAPLEFLAKLLRTAPRAAACKISRHVFRHEAALKPNKEVFEAIRELRLL